MAETGDISIIYWLLNIKPEYSLKIAWIEYIDVTKCSSNPRCKLNSRLKCPLKGVKNLLAAPRLVPGWPPPRPPVCCLTFSSQWCWIGGFVNYYVSVTKWGFIARYENHTSSERWHGKTQCSASAEQWVFCCHPELCVSVTWYNRLYAGKDEGGMLRSHHLILITDNFNVSTGCQIKWIRFLILHICPDIYSGTDNSNRIRHGQAL